MRCWEVGDFRVAGNEKLNESAYYVWFQRNDPYLEGTQTADWEDAVANSVADVKSQLYWRLRRNSNASAPLAQLLIGLSAHAHAIWCEGRRYRSVDTSDETHFVAAMGRQLLGCCRGADFMLGAGNWPKAASGNRQDILAYGMWQTRGKPDGEYQQHGALAGWLCKLGDESFCRAVEPETKTARRLMSAFGQLIISDPYAVIEAFNVRLPWRC